MRAALRKFYQAHMRKRVSPLMRARISYFWNHGRIGRLKDPRRYSELMCHGMALDSLDRAKSDECAWMFGKIETKEHVASLPLNARVIPTVWFGSDVAELESVDLPDSWIAKPNNSFGSFGLVAGKGKPTPHHYSSLRASLAFAADNDIVRQMEALRRVKHGLLVEPRIGNGVTFPDDYKVHVFRGRAQVVQHMTARGVVDTPGGLRGYHAQMWYDRSWKVLPVRVVARSSTVSMAQVSDCPPRLEQMLKDAETIAGDRDYLRVDFFDDGQDLWLCEVEPYTGTWAHRFVPDSFDRWLGDLWRGVPVAPWPSR